MNGIWGIYLLSWLILLLLGYFLGCLNGSVMVSHFVIRDDVRQHGSGNAGLTNFYRTYGAKCALALNGDEKFVDIFSHEAAKPVPRTIPFCVGSKAAAGESTVEMKGFAEGHYGEFVNAIRGVGPWYEQTHSRCFSDIEYCIPQMEGILVGCVAQQVPGKLDWDSATQSFVDNAAANALVKPFIRKGWEF